MRVLKQIGLAMTAIMTVVLAMPVAAQNTAESAAAIQTTKMRAPAAVKREIVVSLEERKLALIEDGKVIKTYPVAVGKPSTPSPVGSFTIERRVMNPTYSHDGRIVPPGPNNPVGSRWIGLSIRGYGIHGTNVPNSIGKAASHGCIRMAKADLEELYPLVAEGDTVELVGYRNEETAQLFGGSVDRGPAAQSAPQTNVASTAPVQVAPQANHPVTAADQSPAAAAIDSLTHAGLMTAAGLAIAGTL